MYPWCLLFNEFVSEVRNSNACVHVLIDFFEKPLALMKLQQNSRIKTHHHNTTNNNRNNIIKSDRNRNQDHNKKREYDSQQNCVWLMPGDTTSKNHSPVKNDVSIWEVLKKNAQHIRSSLNKHVSGDRKVECAPQCSDTLMPWFTQTLFFVFLFLVGARSNIEGRIQVYSLP